MAKLFKKLTALFVSVFVVFCSVFTVGAEEQTVLPDSYTLIAQNKSFVLFAEMEKSGNFAVYDISAKKWWYSGQNAVLDKESEAFALNTGRIKTELVSLVSVEYVQVSTIASTAVPLYQNSYAYCVTEGNVKTKRIKNGYRAEYYFSDIKTTVPLEIVLNKKGINVKIVGKDLKIAKDFRVISISLLPGFMASDTKDGYVFVPSGSGALIPFGAAKGDITTYSETVYGSDTALKVEEYKGEEKNIRIPVYGIKCGTGAVTAIIKDGDATAKINADSDSLTSSFTRVYSQYITSVVDSTTLFESNFENQRIINGAEEREKLGDFSVDFCFLSGDKADYSGMAEVYRDYLSLNTKANPPQLMISLYGAAEKKASFLGIPYNKKIALTSFDEAGKILEYYNDKDVKTAIQYIGWNSDGIYNKKADKSYSPAFVLGGKSNLNKLINYANETENEIFLDNDFMLIKKSGRGFSAYSDVCKSIFNTRTPIYKFMLSVYVPVNNENPSYLLTPENVKKCEEKFFKTYKADTGVSLGSFGYMLYSDFSENVSRNDTLKIFKNILADISENKKLALSDANAYTYKYTDTVFSLPTVSDGNLLFGESVPFLQMVLHGSLSYSAESGNNILDCIEYGANPYYYGIYKDAGFLMETSYNWLYGSGFDNWKKESVEMFNKYNSVYKDLYDKKIVGHSKKENVSKTVFEDGTAVYVNRNENPVELDGIEVGANDFAVSEGR